MCRLVTRCISLIRKLFILWFCLQTGTRWLLFFRHFRFIFFLILISNWFDKFALFAVFFLFLSCLLFIEFLIIIYGLDGRILVEILSVCAKFLRTHHAGIRSLLVFATAVSFDLRLIGFLIGVFLYVLIDGLFWWYVLHTLLLRIPWSIHTLW